ncbi:conserved protein, unknown function [Hepatocystis sp. ex Piliocolobus tephrosceles]|nr:conserved protein, unknown function [Hepatocystis sp. ex Piliocolobus tephrosceles]
MGKVNVKDYKNICQWYKMLSSRKPKPLLPEKKDDRLKNFTNFSLYHIMDKYEFVPNFILQTEYLYPLLYNNPETLRQSYFNHYKLTTENAKNKVGNT